VLSFWAEMRAIRNVQAQLDVAGLPSAPVS
jgi:hypothetical protein